MMPLVKIRCALCKGMMTQDVIPYRNAAAGCDDGCPARPHLHVRCESCSPPGAYFAIVIRDNGNVEMIQ